MTQGDDADIVAGLVALLLELVNDAAHQGNQHTLRLVAFHQGNGLVSRGSSAQNDGHAGNITGNQGHAQRTDNCIGQMAIAGSLIGSGVADVLQNLDELCAQGSGNAGHEGIMQPVVAGHEGLDNAQSLFQLTQILHLHAGHAVVAGQRICSVGEGYGLCFAVLRNGVVYGCFGQAVNSIIAAKNSFKKCHGFSS